jgi:serine/threonine protein kinase
MGQSVATRDSPDIEKPANEFKVVRRLGAGSYAVVYLVSEILYRPRSISDEGHVGSMDMGDGDRYRPSTVFGRQYAIKCLSKANLDDEALAAQMSEVLSLPIMLFSRSYF